MNKAVAFLKQCGTFYVATEDGKQPRVRPFGAIMEYQGKVYICTNNQKKCFEQMTQNPRIEISATKDGAWIRMCGEPVPDPDKKVKAAMLEEYPELKGMYNPEDGIYEVLYLKDPYAAIYSFTGNPEPVEF